MAERGQRSFEGLAGAKPKSADSLREAALERPDFAHDLSAAIDATLRERLSAALVIISIDHLDIVNTAFGHEVGTAVLAAARDELIKVVRATDSVWRFAGSKFAVIMRDASESDVRTACLRFRAAMRDHVYDTSAGPISVTASVGAVMIPDQARTADEARVRAMIAVDAARRDRWRGMALYRPDPVRDQQRADDAEAAQNVIAAIAQNRMCLAFQPIASAKTGEIIFHEALVRIIDTEGRMVDAGQFIAAAERLGLIRLVDHQALRLALETVATYRTTLSINISVDTCHDPAWLAKLTLALEEQPQLAQWLIVEITESQAGIHLDEVRTLVEALRALGCRVAIDDFGAGYTSFRSLKSLPIDIVKIDGAFARDIEHDPENRVFVQSLVAIAHAIDAETVIEWVDGPEAASIFRDIGVDYLQGYSIGMPQSAPVAPKA